MEQNNQALPQKNDEIDLRELLITLWQGKWLIAFITAIFFACGLAYVLFFQTHTATFDIEPVNSYEIDHYSELNYLLQQVELVDLTPESRNKLLEAKQAPAITSQVLVELLMERVRSRQDFVNAVQQLNFIPKGDKTDEQWRDAITKFVYRINFLPPSTPDELAKNRGAGARINWQIQAQGIKEPLSYKSLLGKTLKDANEQVRVGLIHRIQNEIDVLQSKQQNKIEDIDIQIKNLRESYKENIANRIAYLKDQAQIARKLNIAKNTIEAQSFNGASGVVTTLQSETPFYLRGYEAIEEELTLLENRKTVDEYIPELIDLKQKRRSIEEDKLATRLAVALKQSHVDQPEAFVTADLDMDEIRFERTPAMSLLLLGVLFIGMFIGTSLIFILSIFRSTSSNK